MLDSALGLLRRSNPRSLLFHTSAGIHTFFMKVPIDVMVVTNDFKVVKLATVLPNQLFFWNMKYRIIIELPKGAIRKSQTQVGDVLSLVKSAPK
jgi:uncharacterized membrane protein (UPF0127 family)